MPGMALIFGAAAALGLGVMAMSKKDSANPAGPPGTPEGAYSENELALITEFKTLPDSTSARYWRPAIAAVLMGSLDGMTAELVTASADGTSYLYRLVQGRYTGPTSQARSNAAALVFNAPPQGWAALVSLSYWMSPKTGPHFVMLVRPGVRAKWAGYGKGFAVASDDSLAPSLTPPQPGAPPPVPPVPPVPGVPGVPGAVPGPVPPVPVVPPGVPPTPGPGPVVPGVVSEPWPYDQTVPELTRPSAWYLLREVTDPAKLDLGAAAADHAGWPLLANAYRQRAVQLRGPVPGVVPPVPGVPVVPGVVVPAVPAGLPHVIRTGDIPYILAEYFTGNGMRWKEIVAATPGMKIVTQNGQTMPSPWKVGQTIILPAAWNPWAKPTPAPAQRAVAKK